MQLHDVLQVLNALERAGVRYAVIGAVAMATHGLDRATRDLDLFVADDTENVERLRTALRRVYDDPDVDQIIAEDLQGEFPVVQYGPPATDYTIDIVSRLGDAYAFDDLELMTVDVGETTFHVVTPRTLYEMKRNTVRPRDRDDAERLRRAFDLSD